ncbi:MAG: amino acid ABC transporter substrate-binding protein [Oscillospiraceae bacterium]|nr:amino acid ABC transporter substrate-binding protein [Oscillospiraceae bacterium]
MAACGGGNGGTAATTTAAGTTAGNTTAAETQTVPMEGKKLTVGFDAGFPPMGFTDDKNKDKYIGFDLDLAKAVADYLKAELVLKPIDWKAKDTELEAGNIDCIWNGFTKNEDRLDKYAWTDAYMLNEQVVVVMKDSGYEKFDDLAGKKAGLQETSTAEAALDKAAELKASLADVVKSDDNTICLTNLESGVVDAVVMDSVVANYMIAKSGKDYKVIGSPLSPEEYAVGFALTNAELRNTVEAAMKALVADGTFKDISVQWFGKDVIVLK